MTDGTVRVSTPEDLDALGLGAVVVSPLGGRYVSMSEWRGRLAWAFEERSNHAVLSSVSLLRLFGTMTVAFVQ